MYYKYLRFGGCHWNNKVNILENLYDLCEVNMKNLDNKALVVSAGAGIGVIQTIWSKEWGLFPVIGEYFGPVWGKWSTIGNILIGGIVFGVTTFTNVLAKKHKFVNTALQVYGITAVIGGFANGVFGTSLGATTNIYGKAKGLAATGGEGYFTREYYNAPPGQFYRRPQSKAQGFGSDITKNPMAAIQTTISYDKRLA